MPTRDEVEALYKEIIAAARNVELCRNHASLESLAGWEHQAMRKAATLLRALAEENERVTLQRDEAREQFDSHVAWASNQQAAAEARAIAAEEALKPFITEMLLHRGENPYSLHRNGDERWERYVPSVQAALQYLPTLTSQPEAGEPWEPIETAPKDGSYVDLWCAPLTEAGVALLPCRIPNCYWVDDYAAWYASSLRGEPIRVWHRVTHWMTPPNAPGTHPIAAGDGEKLEICPDCTGAGGDNNVWTCPKCGGTGGVRSKPGREEIRDMPEMQRMKKLCGPPSDFDLGVAADAILALFEGEKGS